MYWQNFLKIYRADFFQGNDLKSRTVSFFGWRKPEILLPVALISRFHPRRRRTRPMWIHDGWQRVARQFGQLFRLFQRVKRRVNMSGFSGKTPSRPKFTVGRETRHRRKLVSDGIPNGKCLLAFLRSWQWAIPSIFLLHHLNHTANLVWLIIAKTSSQLNCKLHQNVREIPAKQPRINMCPRSLSYS